MKKTIWTLVMLLVGGTAAFAQSTNLPSAVPESNSTTAPAPVEITSIRPAEPANDRVFGVLPNYRTTNGNDPYTPITAKQKLMIAKGDSTDWPELFVTGFFALLNQAENQNPSYGQGMKGFGKRYVASYGDQAIGNMLAEGILPAVFHEDPRYFRVGEGNKFSRTMIALKQIVVTRTDSGSTRFNNSEIVGGILSAGIANAYYTDSRTWGDNIERFGLQVGNDAISNVLKEFWPDVKQRFFTRHGG